MAEAVSERADLKGESPSNEGADQRSPRSDPRRRPPDPAGTQPKFDPGTLVPTGDLLALPVAGTDSGDAVVGSPGDGTDLGEAHEILPEPLPSASPPALGTPCREVPHAPRFQFLFGVLGALGVVAIAIAVSLALAPASRPGVPWSSWKPSGDVDPATQIAAHVEAKYVLRSGHRLVGVTGGPQAIGGQPVVVALRSSGSAPAPLAENGVFYQLCGDGPNCSISGKASRERGMLVTREALELALYTFHYIGGASQVVVTFPPLPPGTASSTGEGSKKSSETSTSSGLGSRTSTSTTASIGAKGPPSHVLLFRPSDLAPQLSRPLYETLSEPTPTTKTVASAPEARLVGELTVNLVYDSVLVAEPQANSVLLLQRPSIGG
jgi:hypothetical protein